MTRLIPPSSDSSAACLDLGAAHDADRFGGKSAGLARLIGAGLPVPAGFAIPSEAYDDWVSAGSGELPDSWRKDIANHYECLPKGAVAVRSSATNEDSAATSFAGQHETVLGVVGEENVLDAVVACFRSADDSTSYRSTVGASAGSMAVTVQLMVDADAAGVCFTADPVSGIRSDAVVEAVHGIGESLVSGEAHPDRYVVDQVSGSVSVRDIAAEFPVLTDSQILAVVEQARKCEIDGDPIDVEWALADGEVWLLQARPVTATGGSTDDSEVRLSGLEIAPDERWTRLLGDEFWADAASPLCFSIMGRALDDVMIKGVDAVRGLNRLDQHRAYLRLYEGRVYWSETALLETLRMSPRFLRGERMLAWLSPASRERVRREPFRLGAFIKAEVTAARREPDSRIDRQHKKLDDILQHARTNAAAFNIAPMVSRQDLRKRRREVATTISTQFASLRWGVLVHASGMAALLEYCCESWLDDPALVGVLLSGMPTKTLDVNRELWILGQTPDGPDFDRELAAFLERHGHRAGSREPAEPRWAETPDLVASFARASRGNADPASLLEAAAAKRDAAEAEALAHLNPLKRIAFKRLLAITRTYVHYREEQRYENDRVLATMRTYGLAVGKFAADRGLIDRPDDAFMLTVDEIDELLDGKADDAQKFRDRIAARRIRYERAKFSLPPDFLMGDEPDFGDAVSGADDTATLTGTGVSAGVAEGVARVVRTLETADILAPGEILVTSNTDPGWTPLFARAGGLVLETGGMLAHGAVVAREYGLPAVSGVAHATNKIEDGTRIRVDGRRGVVEILTYPDADR